ncbi:prepilin-type N-terminal cleavage/methylation domain-containing protein [Candidatus Gottesmanbacteria bacterium]|nr:prepilin-type N-terminal cleavage/methylation domain-containing protein [Candidatus Gottesmanbacteria bacterium]
MKKGQTLIEIIVAMAVVVLLVTGLVAGATATLKAAQYGRAKSLAASLAQEALEKARGLRDGGWETFSTYGSVGGTTWCLDKAGNWTQASGSCSANIDNLYSRTVVFTWQDPKMKVDVAITWTDGSYTYRVDQTTYFTQWQ